MTIYGEYLFLENAITGAVILCLTGKVCGRKRSAGWILVGSLLCGGYAFILFVPLNGLVCILSKLAFSVGVVWLVFHPDTRLALGKMTMTFYVVSFLMGGTTVAVMYLTGMPGVSANGSVYIHKITYLQIMAGVTATGVLGYWLADYLKEKRYREEVMTEIEIQIDTKKWKAKAFVDTGNFLKDPVTGKPAILVSPVLGKRIMESMEDEKMLCRNCVIPYHSIGNSGVLHGLRTDEVRIEDTCFKGIILAISEREFAPWKGTEIYEALLQQQLMDGRKREYA